MTFLWKRIWDSGWFRAGCQYWKKIGPDYEQLLRAFFFKFSWAKKNTPIQAGIVNQNIWFLKLFCHRKWIKRDLGPFETEGLWWYLHINQINFFSLFLEHNEMIYLPNHHAFMNFHKFTTLPEIKKKIENRPFEESLQEWKCRNKICVWMDDSFSHTANIV